jgi:pimeloyl-ACP methyl ester carboxylesterase
LTDPSAIVGAGRAPTQAGDYSALPGLARRIGLRFADATPPRPLSLRGADGQRLNALDWGGDGPHVLFLHGGKLTARTWDYVCLGLRDQVRCVALDMRGHGDSEWTDDYGLRGYVADIGAVLDGLGWPTVHLVGMSLGGFSALHFAASSPRRIASLAIVDVGPGVVFGATERMRGFIQAARPDDGLEAIVEAAMRASPRSDRERVAYRMATMLRPTEAGGWAWAHDDRRPTDYPALLAAVDDMAAAAGRVAAPCLVVRGGRSRVLSSAAAQSFAACLAHGECVVAPGAGHNVQEDNPTGLIAALRRFWSRRCGLRL